MKEFSSFGALARHLEVMAAIGEEVTHHVTEEAAKIIQKDAKKKIGEYQGYAGPFAAWPELADATKDDRLSRGFTENDPLLRTGELRESITYTARGNEAVVGSDSDIALYQELGTETIPARSFLGGAAYESKLPVGEMAARTIIAWVSGLGWKRPAKVSLPGPNVT